MKTDQFRYAIAIKEEKTLSAAAKKLGISQPSLSTFLAGLEEELGTDLFYREKKQLFPTPAGQIYLRAAERILNIESRTEMSIRQIQHREKETLRIAATPLRGSVMFASLFAAFSQRYPSIRLELTESYAGQIFEEVRTGEAALGLSSFTDIEDPDFSGIPVSREEVILAVPSYYAQNTGEKKPSVSDPGKKDFDYTALPQVSIEQFRDAPFVLYKKGTPLRAVTDSLFSVSDIYPTVVYESGNNLVIRNLVRDGAGAALMPVSQMNSENTTVTYCRLTERYYINLGIIMKRDAQVTEPIRYFAYLMRQNDAEKPCYLPPERGSIMDRILKEFGEEEQ